MKFWILLVAILSVICIDSLCIDEYGGYVNIHLPEVEAKSHFRKSVEKFSHEQECMQVFRGVCFVPGICA